MLCVGRAPWRPIQNLRLVAPYVVTRTATFRARPLAQAFAARHEPLGDTASLPSIIELHELSSGGLFKGQLNVRGGLCPFARARPNPLRTNTTRGCPQAGQPWFGAPIYSRSLEGGRAPRPLGRHVLS